MPQPQTQKLRRMAELRQHASGEMEREAVAAADCIDSLRAELARREEQITTVLRVEAALRETVRRATKALRMGCEAINREQWQKGPTLAEAASALHNEAENNKHEITIDGAEHQLRWAARKALDYKATADRYRALLERIASVETRPQDKQSWPGRALVRIRDDAAAAIAIPSVVEIAMPLASGPLSLPSDGGGRG